MEMSILLNNNPCKIDFEKVKITENPNQSK